MRCNSTGQDAHKRRAGGGGNLVVGHSFGTSQALRLAAREARDARAPPLALALVGAAAAVRAGGHPVFKLPVESPQNIEYDAFHRVL